MIFNLIVAVAVVLLGLRMLPWVADAYTNVVVLGKSPNMIYQESHMAPNVPMADYIRSHTQPGDTISIFGDAPWIYLLADRANATRFPFVNLWIKKTGGPTYGPFTQQFYDGLTRNRPVYFILTKPNFPWQNNDYIEDWEAATAIHDYVEANYTYEGENGPFLLFRRNVR